MPEVLAIRNFHNRKGKFGEVSLPVKASSGAAAFDIRAFVWDGTADPLEAKIEYEDYVVSTAHEIINPGSYKTFGTGWNLLVPFGYVGKVCSRSGLAAKNGVFVLNAPGIIDQDYTGEIAVVMSNCGAEPFKVTHGNRIAQILFERLPETAYDGEPVTIREVDYVEWGVAVARRRDEIREMNSLHAVFRGDGGLGSTGVV